MNVVMMMGRTAAGKTTLSQYLADALSARYVSEAALKRALVRDYRTEFSLDEALRDLGYSAAAAVARECVAKGESVVVDAAYHRVDRRRQLIDATAHADRRLLVAYCRCSDERETRRRIDARATLTSTPFTQANSFAIYEHIDRTFEEISDIELHAGARAVLLMFDSWTNSFTLMDRGARDLYEQLQSLMDTYVSQRRMLEKVCGSPC